MNLANKPPLGLKEPKVKPDLEYLARVRGLPCCACGRYGRTEAHHCRDMPDFNERGLYERLPGAAQKSGDHDAIPLCGDCHRAFHLRRSEFHARYGRDYGFIPVTRANLGYAEIDF